MPARVLELLRPGWTGGAGGPGRLGALGLATLSLAAATLARAEPRAQGPDAGARLVTFSQALQRLRAGDDQARESLLSSAEVLAREHDRPDALEVARFFVVLDAEALAAGLALEREYEALHREAVGAMQEELRGEEWDELREELTAELERLAERALPLLDPTPAARALTLLARFDIDRVERDGRLAANERALLLERAVERAERALTLFERAGMRTPTLEPAWVLARADHARGRLGLAREQYATLAELASSVHNPSWRRKALQALGDLALERGDLDESARLLRELALGADPRADWFVARRHAQALFAADRPREALEFLDRARPKRARELDEWRLLAGGAWLRLGERERARALYQQLSESAGLDRELAFAALELRGGEHAAALARLEALALDGERADVQAKGCAWLGEARLATGDAAGAVLALEQAFAAAELWRARHRADRPGEDPVINVHGEVLGLHATVRLARAQAALGRGLAAAAAIEHGQSRSLAEAAGMEAAGLEESLRAWAAASPRGLVTWAVGADDGVVAHVAADGDARAWPLPHGRGALAAAVQRLREATLDPREERLAGLASELRAALFPPELEARLAVRPGTREEALFLLHGPLERLPLELVLELPLAEGRAAGALIARVLPGLPAPRPGAAVATDELGAWSLLGDPWARSDSLWQALPGARDELDALARLYPEALEARGPAFDREALSSALRGTLPLHLATHLVPGCDDGPTRLAGVGIVLSGSELFCPGEIRALRPSLPLVVLSGCESQAGRWLDAEGLLGTARAFLESGTRNLLVTLWPIEDGAAREAALAFHGALRAGAEPARAAHSARGELRRRGLPAADWAAFRLLGRD